ncbi:MAG: MEDS domain-containing protein [Massilia sp.]
MAQLTSKSRKGVDVFWAEMAACEHCVQIYDSEAVFLDALEGFVAAGLRQNEACILIATTPHLLALSERLLRSGVDLGTALANDQFIALDAQTTLATFMQDGWPDEALFLAFVTKLLGRVRPRYPQVRAFGEMVALLWANGEHAATIRLEHLWAKLCKSEEFSLFCAYPRAGFTQDADQSMMDVHLAHSLVFNEA